MKTTVAAKRNRTAALSNGVVRRQTHAVTPATLAAPSSTNTQDGESAVGVGLEVRRVVGVGGVEPRGHEERGRRRDERGRTDTA